MENSILTSTKKNLGIAPEYTAFDLDIITHINSALSSLTQLGVGPATGFVIEDETPQWADFIGTDPRKESVKTFVYLKVKLIFDPPPTSFVIAAFEKQIDEIAWRLSVDRENEEWVDPDPPVITEEVI
jgi:hypothetical protein